MVQMTVQTIAAAARKIHDNIELVVVGKAEVVELVLVAVLRPPRLTSSFPRARLSARAGGTVQVQGATLPALS